MTIKELIEKLNQFDQNMEVIISDGHKFDLSYHLNDAEFAALSYKEYYNNCDEQNNRECFLDIGVGGNRIKLYNAS
jgi:hypothetical protein